MSSSRWAAGLLVLAGCMPTEPQPGVPEARAIDSAVTALMARESVQGLALAVIDDGQVVHVAAHGWRNAAKRLPLDTTTIMYGASLTKAMIGYLTL